ncbi:single-stranded DNA-binding protein [Mesorhizobium sp. ANAO-SY3R2]|uniref:single-stranded DNA-binding protein n=1 Tax=Mesorhizobium sp. ANAO-SY3R2 TaxID=3166644 RepID=UPI00366CDCE7
MAGINKVTLVGRVGQDPKVTNFNSGDMSVEFSLATSESWRDKQTGERKERTQWHKIKILNQAQAKIAEQYVRKGSLIGIVGEIQYREYEKDGDKRYVTEIVVGAFRGELHLLGSKDDNAGNGDGRRDDGGRQDDRGRPPSGGSSGGRRDDNRNDRGGYGQQSGGSDRGSYGGAGGGGYYGGRDLDDEIPFAMEWR